MDKTPKNPPEEESDEEKFEKFSSVIENLLVIFKDLDVKSDELMKAFEKSPEYNKEELDKAVSEFEKRMTKLYDKREAEGDDNDAFERELEKEQEEDKP